MANSRYHSRFGRIEDMGDHFETGEDSRKEAPLRRTYRRPSLLDDLLERGRRLVSRYPTARRGRALPIVPLLIGVASVGAILLSIGLSRNAQTRLDVAQPAQQALAVPTSTPVALAQATPVPTPYVAPTQTPIVQAVDSSLASVEDSILEGVPQTDHALGLPKGEQVADSYFDDAVFIGDSVTLKLNYYVRDTRKTHPTLLGGAQFLTAGSLGSGNALQDVSAQSLHPSYQGKKQLIEDSVAEMGAGKVYIMLGMNDIAVYGPEESARNMMRLARRIKDKSPNCKIFIQSATPRIKGNYQKLNNNALFEYDLMLYQYCQQYAAYDVYFVDVAYVMRDAEGNLPLNYCSDAQGQGIHFTNIACREWLRYLYTHTI